MMQERISTIEQLEEFVRSQEYMMKVLELARSIDLPDRWIGAGFLRNPVWDIYHRQSIIDFGSDVDVVYFDPIKSTPEDDRSLDDLFSSKMPEVERNIRNQSRMHLKNGNDPYTSACDGIAHWNETATSVALKLNQDNTFSWYAAYGWDDLRNCVCKPTPSNFNEKADVYPQRRIDKSNRKIRRPNLHIIMP